MVEAKVRITRDRRTDFLASGSFGVGRSCGGADVDHNLITAVLLYYIERILINTAIHKLHFILY
jgi:hypothetical protein